MSEARGGRRRRKTHISMTVHGVVAGIHAIRNGGVVGHLIEMADGVRWAYWGGDLPQIGATVTAYCLAKPIGRGPTMNAWATKWHASEGGVSSALFAYDGTPRVKRAAHTAPGALYVQCGAAAVWADEPPPEGSPVIAVCAPYGSSAGKLSLIVRRWVPEVER